MICLQKYSIIRPPRITVSRIEISSALTASIWFVFDQFRRYLSYQANERRKLKCLMNRAHCGQMADKYLWYYVWYFCLKQHRLVGSVGRASVSYLQYDFHSVVAIRRSRVRSSHRTFFAPFTIIPFVSPTIGFVVLMGTYILDTRMYRHRVSGTVFGTFWFAGCKGWTDHGQTTATPDCSRFQSHQALVPGSLGADDDEYAIRHPLNC
jgi:hypothetical protein